MNDENLSNGNGNINGNGKKEKEKKSGAEYNIKDPPSHILEKRLKSVVRHITHVQQSCTLLGERLILASEKQLGHKLISNGFIHDNSKFHGIEWLYLHDDIKEFEPDLFNSALIQHTRENPHHPEYWDGIINVPRVYLAEMVCDWHARSNEFGTGLRDFIKESATKKYDFNMQTKIYKEIKYFVDLLLDPAFVSV